MPSSLIPLLLTGLLILGACSPAPLHSDPWFFVVAADPQLYMDQEDDRFWRQSVNGINRLNPDFVIVCGDLINAENDAKKWREPATMLQHEKLAADYLAVANELDVKLYNVAGNHDVSLQPTPETIAWFTARFGEPWYSFEHKDSLFVVLESNLMRDSAGAPALAMQQWNWFKKTLVDSSRREFVHKTVYMHHPVCRESVDEKEDYFNLPLAKRRELLALLHEHGFDAVFCGHFHRNAYVKDGNLELITTASCCAPLGKDPRGMRIVRVFKDRLVHTYHALDDLPAAVRFDTESKSEYESKPEAESVMKSNSAKLLTPSQSDPTPNPDPRRAR